MKITVDRYRRRIFVDAEPEETLAEFHEKISKFYKEPYEIRYMPFGGRANPLKTLAENGFVDGSTVYAYPVDAPSPEVRSDFDARIESNITTVRDIKEQYVRQFGSMVCDLIFSLRGIEYPDDHVINDVDNELYFTIGVIKRCAHHQAQMDGASNPPS